MAFDEITDGDITVRQGDGRTTYTITNDVLFEFDVDTLTTEAEAKLLLVAASIAERFENRVEIQVWGHADAIGDPAYNPQAVGNKNLETVRLMLYEENIGTAGLPLVDVGPAEEEGDSATP